MKFGAFSFKPGLIPTLVTLLMLPLLIGLGFWQLDRARQKEALGQSFVTRLTMPRVSISALNLADPASRYRKVTVQGRYDTEHQLLLDNQVQNGQPGYHVYTPLKVTGENQAILINRGWVPVGESRERLPDVAAPRGEIILEGMLAQPANPGLRLGIDKVVAGWPQVMSYLDYEQVTAMLGYSLVPAVVLLNPEARNGFQREWQSPTVGFGPERHRGYALQWFSLALTLLVIYLVVNTRRRDSREVKK